METELVCEECREPVSSDGDVQTCPRCGYNPSWEHRKWGMIDGVVAFVLFLTLVGIPFSLYLSYRSLKHSAAAENATVGVEP